jgi:hypothetical protein
LHGGLGYLFELVQQQVYKEVRTSYTIDPI